MPNTIALPFDLIVAAPNRAPLWIIQTWRERTGYVHAPPELQPLGFVAPYAQHVLLGTKNRPWVGRVEHFIVGRRWMVSEALGFLAIDGVETIDLPTGEQHEPSQPVLGISYSEAQLPAGELQAAPDSFAPWVEAATGALVTAEDWSPLTDKPKVVDLMQALEDSVRDARAARRSDPQ